MGGDILLWYVEMKLLINYQKGLKLVFKPFSPSEITEGNAPVQGGLVLPIYGARHAEPSSSLHVIMFLTLCGGWVSVKY